jgi:hypothetical protein
MDPPSELVADPPASLPVVLRGLYALQAGSSSLNFSSEK